VRICPQEIEEESETGVKYTPEQWQRIDDLRGLLKAREEAEGVAVAEGVAEGDLEITTAVIAVFISVVIQDTSCQGLHPWSSLAILQRCIGQLTDCNGFT